MRNLHPFYYSSEFAVIQLKRLIKSLNKLDFEVRGSSRIARYVKELESPSTEFNSPEHVMRVNDVVNLLELFQYLPNSLTKKQQDRMKWILKGTDVAYYENGKGEARNYFIEQILDFKIQRLAFPFVDFKNDVCFRSGKTIIHIECKRIHSSKKVEANVKDALRQLRSQYTINSLGLIHISLEKILFNKDGVNASNLEYAEKVIENKVFDWYEEYDELWDEVAKDGQTVALLVKTNIPSYLKESGTDGFNFNKEYIFSFYQGKPTQFEGMTRFLEKYQTL